MSDTTNPGVPRKLLPPGLSIQLTQQVRTYGWHHATTVGGGDASLNGLLHWEKKPEDQPKLPSFTKELGEITQDHARDLSQNLSNLPAMLKKAGVQVLDDQRELFIQKATEVKHRLARAYVGQKIPSAEIKKADAEVNQYAFQCVEIIIRGFSVTRDNPKGSRQRKSDGLYVTERILRRICISVRLSEKDVKDILDVVCGQLVASMAREANYSIRSLGRDAGGNPIFALSMDSYRKTPTRGTTNSTNTGTQNPGSSPGSSGSKPMNKMSLG